MLFNSLHFILFLPIALFIYTITPKKGKWIPLLISSYYFYMSWRAEFIVLIILSTLTDYVAGRSIYTTESKRAKILWVWVSIIVNLGLLFSFKYLNFFSGSVQSVLQFISLPIQTPIFDILLPVGISFYTFQTISYTIDVYRGRITPERHFGVFAVYVSYFPQLVAGPIERAKTLIPQIKAPQKPDEDNTRESLLLILWGFFKKLVIADGTARIVNIVYGDPFVHGGGTLLIATALFSFQIYCDFSGYTDIARGTSGLMGIKLTKNFNQPYFAKSIREFWGRWHITLSQWFRDYVYIPLGGKNVTNKKWVRNVLVVFILSGLWHGANWTFILWGLLHGTYIFIEKKTARLLKIWTPMRILITFILVNIGWVFFRSDTITAAMHIITTIVKEPLKITLTTHTTPLILSMLFIGCLVSVQTVKEYMPKIRILFQKPLLQWISMVILFQLTLLFGTFNSTQFIYFQF